MQKDVILTPEGLENLKKEIETLSTDRRREVLAREFADRPAELKSALDELTETMAAFESARDPDDLIGPA